MSKIKCDACGLETDSALAFCCHCGNKIENLKLINKIFNLFSRNKLPKKVYEKFIDVRKDIEKINSDISKSDYIDTSLKNRLKKDFESNYYLCLNLNSFHDDEKIELKDDELNLVNSFIENYENIDSIAKDINEKYINKLYDEFKQNKEDYQAFVDKFKTQISYDEPVTENKKDFKNDYEFIKKLISFKESDDWDFGEDLGLMNDFIEVYNNFDAIKNEINEEISKKERILNNYDESLAKIQEFISKFKNNVSDELYIDDFNIVLKDYELRYDACKELSNLSEKYHTDEMVSFLEVYENFEEVSKNINENYLKRCYQLFSDKNAEIKQLLVKYQNLTIDMYLENKKSFINDYSQIHERLIQLVKHDYSLKNQDLKIIDEFKKLFDCFNGDFPQKVYKKFSNYKFLLTKFLNKYGVDGSCDEYIFNKNDCLKTYSNAYDKTRGIFKLDLADELDLPQNEQDKIFDFLVLYDNFEDYIEKNNECHIKKLNNEFSTYKSAILEFIDSFDENKFPEFYINNEKKSEILKDNKKYWDFANKMNKIPETANDISTDFIYVYSNFDDIVFKMNHKIVNKLYSDNEEFITKFAEIINLKQNYYISNSKLNILLDEYYLYSPLILNLKEYCMEYEYLEDNSKLLAFPNDEYEFINSIHYANEAFIKRELKENKLLFDNVVPGKPLDKNQRRAVVIDEDNTQIIAGAGCGKTLTLQAKAKYLIEKQKINPSEILAISFSKFSAKDLKYKMENIGLNIDVSTFHALGLDILRKNNVKAKVDEYALKTAIKKYFTSKIINDKEMSQKIIEYFAYYMYEPLDKENVENIGEVYDYEWGMDLETFYGKLQKLKDSSLEKTSLQGEIVKSLEERRIANFLFLNGVKYRYEKEYEPKIDWKKTHDYLNTSILKDIEMPSYIKKDLINQIMDYLEIDKIIRWPNDNEVLTSYHPDFYLEDYDIYYEHFGVNRECSAPWLSKIKSQEYRQGIFNKRKLHKKYGTKLMETYSYYQSENRLLERLKEKLEENGVQFNEIDYQQIMREILEVEGKINEYWDFIKLIETFINLFKGNGYDKEKFREFRIINENFEGFTKEKHELFLDIAEDIYDFYYTYLEKHKLIDFNDMINYAVDKVENNGFYKNYKYIMVDEFQDTSHTRFNLLKSIKKDLNANLIVVGDDWQSIYRFTGCDIDLFTNFENYFDDYRTETCYITNTYRNSQSLIDVSGKFIMENNDQFKKELNSKAKSQIKDTIKLYQYLNYQEQPFVFEKIIHDIYNSAKGNYVNILVLGRNRMDYLSLINEKLFYTTGSVEDKNLKIHYKKNPKISIDYMTVHGSKGLEEENVVLINLTDKKNGFPNKIEDDSVLSFVKNEKEEPIEFAEERRLFYVALTRTLKRTYLLAPKDKKSAFVSELMEDIEIIDFDNSDNEEIFDDKIRTIASTDGVCPDCGTGKINLKFNPKTGKMFFKCSNWPKCDWYGGNFYEDVEELNNPEYCPKCGGLLVKKFSSKHNHYFYGCINYFPNKQCRYIKNIEKDV